MVAVYEAQGAGGVWGLGFNLRVWGVGFRLCVLGLGFELRV